VTRLKQIHLAAHFPGVNNTTVWSDPSSGSQIDFASFEHLARTAERGVLLCTVHVGGMDLIAPALHRFGHDMHVVADDTTYGRLYEHLKAIRARHGMTLIGWRSLRGLFRALKAGSNLVLFCDGGYRDGDVPVEFLGEPTTFPRATTSGTTP